MPHQNKTWVLSQEVCQVLIPETTCNTEMDVLGMKTFSIICANYDPSFVSPLNYLQNILPFALFVI
jgi:hypothetical protein